MRENLKAGRLGASVAAILLMSMAAGCSSTQKPASLAGSGTSTSAASTTAAATSATSPAPSPATSSQPVFKFPADYTLTVDPDTTGDPVKDAILADNADFMKAYNEALAAGNANDPLLLAYGQPVGISSWQQGITQQHSKGLTITGTERIYHRSVDKVDTTKNPATATVYVCDDQSKAFDKEIATGKVHVTPVTDNSFVLYYFGVQKSATGVWQVVHIVTHQNDQAAKQECR